MPDPVEKIGQADCGEEPHQFSGYFFRNRIGGRLPPGPVFSVQQARKQERESVCEFFHQEVFRWNGRAAKGSRRGIATFRSVENISVEGAKGKRGEKEDSWTRSSGFLSLKMAPDPRCQNLAELPF